MQGVPAARLQLQLSALVQCQSSRPSGHVQLGVCCDNDSGGLALAVSRRQILTSFVSQTVTPGTPSSDTDLVCELSVICVRIKPDNDDDDDNFIVI